jgi:hypothetical protein
LANEFPNARFIALRRTPMECVPSQLSAIRGGLNLFGHDPCDPFIVSRFLDLLVHYWRAIDDARQDIEPNRFRLVEYLELTADPYHVVWLNLHELGYDIPEEDRQMLRQLSEQGRQYQSRHHYSLAEYGLSHEQIAAAFGNVCNMAGCPEDAPLASTPLVRTALTSEGCAGIS